MAAVENLNKSFYRAQAKLAVMLPEEVRTRMRI